MAKLSPRLTSDVDRFHERVMTDPIQVVDPEGVRHHEFVSGNHGRKLDYDKIKTGTDLYIDWVALYARTILELYPHRKPDALVGIANGANRLSLNIAHLLGGGVLGLTTEKVDAKTVKLDDNAREAVASGAVKYAVTVEDVGTTGGTTLTALMDLREVGVLRVESTNGHQRNASLPRLDDARVPYEAMILDTSLPTFTPEKCEAEGYCAQGVLLIPHAR